MKKFLLFNFALYVGVAASAQNNPYTLHPVKSAQKNRTFVYDPKVDYLSEQTIPFSSVYTNPTSGNRISNPVSTNSFTSTSITNTGYQSQTNRSGRNAIVMSSDGSISVANTFSAVADGAWADRGAGYNYFSGTWLASPTTRIETVRTGWPSIAVTTSNREHVISHIPATNKTCYNTRPVKGTGAWTQNVNAILSPSVGNLWPRISSGGANGNSLHAISVTTPTGTFGGQVYQGQNGALCYARSTDDGVTWSSWTANPLHDTVSGYGDFGPDDYALDAKGNTVAYVFGGLSMGVTLMKSTDNGTTWTRTSIKSFPIPNYTNQITDTNNDATADTLISCDGSLDVVVDNNGLVHVFFGRMRVINDNPTATGISYFPVTDGLYYWNENMGPNSPTIVTSCIDYDNNGMIDLQAPTPSTDFPFGAFYSSMSSHPTCGVDANNNIFLVYDAIIEYSDDGSGHSYRNIYAMMSNNGGTSWSNPMILDSSQTEEHVYPNIPAHFTGTCIPITYESDLFVGNGISTQPSGSPDPNNLFADIMYGCLPVTDFSIGIHEHTNDLFNVSDNYPNPFNGSSTITITMNKASMVTLDVYDPLGAKVATTVSNEFTSGQHTMTIDGSKLAAGIYFYTVRAGAFTVTKKMIIQ